MIFSSTEIRNHSALAPFALSARIVSLVPSLTETLFDLGLGECVIGITRYCIHPAALVKNIKRIGGTKDIDLDAISQLKPAIIIANKEENLPLPIEELAAKFPVFLTDISCLADVIIWLEDMAILFPNIRAKAIQMGDHLRRSWAALEGIRHGCCLYLIWRKPYMSIGSDTFIHSVLTHLGYTNVCLHRVRYPCLTLEEIIQLNPECVLLSSEPYPFKIKHIEEIRSVLPAANVRLTDGEMYSWYGSHILKAGNYFLSKKDLWEA